ncbi:MULTISPECIES: hypothetical protein [unclassified Marinovum]
METEFAKLCEKLTDALINGNFDNYRAVFRLPARIEPRDGRPYTMTTEDDLRRDHELYVTSMQIHRVTYMTRDVLSVVEITPDWAEITVETSLFSGGHRVVDPFCTQFVLRQAEDGWKIGAIRSSLGHINWTLGKATIHEQRFRPTGP